MALWNWDPFRVMEELSREVGRTLQGGGQRPSPFLRTVFLPGRTARRYPMINLSEDKEAYYVEALAPGVDPESLEVTVVHGGLTISGEKKSTAADIPLETIHRNERAAGNFARSIDLPGEVDESKVTADYKNGLLLIPNNAVEASLGEIAQAIREGGRHYLS